MKTKDLIKNKDLVISELAKKNYDAKPVIKEVESKYAELKKAKIAFDNKREMVNKNSKLIGQTKDNDERQKLIKQVRDEKEEILSLGNKFKEKEDEIKKISLGIPNLPNEVSPVGADDSFNKEILSKKITKSKFKKVPHWDLIEGKVVDSKKSAKLSGSRFVLYNNDGSRLLEALKNLMIDTHTKTGYDLYNVPVIVRSEILEGTGQLPKFKDDLYNVGGNNWLIPTAEVSLTNLFAGDTIDKSELPLKVMAYSSCFRKEAGSAGKDTRGIKRLHQFNKVELVHLTTPEREMEDLNSMLESAKSILDLLELPYRVLMLSTGELTFSSTITYDLEVWMPGQEEWMEISSVSTCGSFQAERMNTKYQDGKNKDYLITQNGSGIAIDRAIAAIVENHQDENGDIIIPKSLVKYLGKDKI